MKIDESKLRDLCDKDISTRRMGEILGYSRKSVEKHIKILGISRKKATSHKPISFSDSLISEYLAGETMKSLAKKYSTSGPTIKKFLIDNGVDIRKHLADTIPIHLMVKDYEGGMSVSEISSKYSISNSHTYELLKRGKCAFRTERNIVQLDETEIKELYQKGMSSTDIARKMGCGYKTITTRLKKLGVDMKSVDDYAPKFQSKAEQEIKEFIGELGIKFIENSRAIISSGEVDIYIPSKNIAIEYNGCYWHSSEFKSINYHKEKYEKCKDENISLIQVWEHHWHKKKDIIKSVLKSRLGIIDSRVYARKCKLKLVTNLEEKEFLDENHIQGYRPAKFTYGLYYQEALVQLMSFSMNISNSYFEIIRLCSTKGTSVVGGTQKLFKHFFNKHSKTVGVITYSDASYFEGNIYEAIGMKRVGKTPPNYFWFKSISDVKNRTQTQKHKLVKLGFDPKMSETEIMTSIGYRKVYGVGNHKFYIPPPSQTL